MSDYYYAMRQLLFSALLDAAPVPPGHCRKCGWPIGGSENYHCPCESGYGVAEAALEAEKEAGE